MGLYNVLKVDLKCPFCERLGEMEAEFKLGYLSVDTYSVGDKIRWASGSAKKPHQKRPEKGSCNGEGYVECPKCHKDFWISILIKEDVIINVAINPTKAGFVK